MTAFKTQAYHSPTASPTTSPERPVAAFAIQRTIEEQAELPSGKSVFRPFHAVRDAGRVAGMVRHAAATVARQMGRPTDWVNTHVLGHGDEKDGQATSDERLLFLPLPSITPLKVESIRRVLVVGPPGFDLAPFRQRLNGHDLIDRYTCQPVAMLSYLPPSDKALRPYTATSAAWSTITPVVLPGFDDPDGLRRKLKERVGADEQKRLLERLDARIVALIWKAFEQAGFSADALRGATMEYRVVGFRPGVGLSNEYVLPPLKYPRYHVRVRFRHPVKGPITIGAGRYRGLGLFAAEE